MLIASVDWINRSCGATVPRERAATGLNLTVRSDSLLPFCVTRTRGGRGSGIVGRVHGETVVRGADTHTRQGAREHAAAAGWRSSRRARPRPVPLRRPTPPDRCWWSAATAPIAVIRAPPPTLRIGTVNCCWSAVTPHWSLASMITGVSGHGDGVLAERRQRQHHEARFGKRVDCAAVRGDHHLAGQVLRQLQPELDQQVVRIVDEEAADVGASGRVLRGRDIERRVQARPVRAKRRYLPDSAAC